MIIGKLKGPDEMLQMAGKCKLQRILLYIVLFRLLMAVVEAVMQMTPAGKVMRWGETPEELVEVVCEKTPGTSQMITGQLQADMVRIQTASNSLLPRNREKNICRCISL
jgi:hypothetical protein